MKQWHGITLCMYVCVSVSVCVCVLFSLCICMLCSVMIVTLHVLTVDTGRVWAAALITRTFISQMRREVTLQTPDPQVKAATFSHIFLSSVLD